MEIGGLPVHILLLHLVVVLAPAVGAVAVAYAVRPARLGWTDALHPQGWLAPLATVVVTGHTGAAAVWTGWRQR